MSIRIGFLSPFSNWLAKLAKAGSRVPTVLCQGFQSLQDRSRVVGVTGHQEQVHSQCTSTRNRSRRSDGFTSNAPLTRTAKKYT